MNRKKPLQMTRHELDKLKKDASTLAVRTVVTCFGLAMIDENRPDDEIKRVYDRLERYVGFIADERISLKEAETILRNHGIEVTT